MRSGFLSRVLGKQSKLDREFLLDCLLDMADERDLLMLIFDGMTEGVLVFDETETMRFANRRAGELLSFDPASCFGRPMSGFVQDEDIASRVRECLRTGEPIRGARAVIFHPEPRALRLEIAPLSDQKGRFGGALVLLLDVTDEKRREAEQAESRRLAALATLSASLAHDIRNPLNSMNIHAQLLERQLKKQGLDDLTKSTRIIRDEIQDLNERLTRFLDAARPRRPQFEPVSVHLLIEETLELLRPELEQSGIVPEYYPPEIHITVFADQVDLRKAFLNILKNAIEAMRSGGRLVIRTVVDSSTVSIVFEDSGPGIPRSIRERVFELGFTTKDTGSGLGLAQVDRCIREHSGTVEITSHEGAGTRITVNLPILSQGQRLLSMGAPRERPTSTNTLEE
ncbi:MAG: PAS domain-containing protein [Candidatus Omnitrophica bacterium]|nr:Signal transduction histidine-protein kinase AtoS [bacterium]NUN95115.1 PAS domain-containing protein [Candidatus Omnitrophota bacterium]